MKIIKKPLCELDHCYSTSATVINGETKLLLAAENNGPCYSFDEKTFAQTTVWETPGGTMSMIPVPGKNGDFLAVQNFRSGFQAQDTTIVWAKPDGDKWIVETILKLPYIHRFDILTVGSVNYILFCTLATSKKDKNDWSDPGKLYAGILPDQLNEPLSLSVIKEGLTKNHGYVRIVRNNLMSAMVAAEEGAFLVTPPRTPGEDWQVEEVISRPVSDMAVTDIDKDGQDEIATIEPFHGNRFVINKMVNGELQEVYQYDGDFDFGHVVWGGILRGTPTFIGGARRGARELFMVRWNFQTKSFETTIIDSNGGPSNVAVIQGDHFDTILCANREIGEAVLYYVYD